ncbi:Serine/threonine-protein kinase StkP [Pseudovibrio axinellae]|uniref:Serine/threonine-protein kinase StkP n=1 Tax=Pseudovibrio axinellae TaxID=989403 RepID=A0A165UMZ6_9HYPH|nr:protein kinase [Pseudovibrio axinellae]KZL12584.1 Serine/threonine-protein kinase StkP [Pseudovibrio axinellae]SEP65732.1 Protein kinase domain-containing protein [Pseudovibrio axinellae]
MENIVINWLPKKGKIASCASTGLKFEGLLKVQSKYTSNSTVRFYRCATSNCMIAEKTLLSSDLSQQTLLRERKALMQLDGFIAPRFVAISESQGEVRLRLRMVDGGLLSEIIAKDVLSPEERSQICENLVMTVNLLHDKGIAHLDLAPNNILLSDEGECGVVLLDFGFCAFAEELPFLRPKNSFTAHLSYAAPEQLGLGTNSISMEADLYALGLIIREIYGYDDHIKNSYDDAKLFRKGNLSVTRLPENWQDIVRNLTCYAPCERSRILTRSGDNNSS